MAASPGRPTARGLPHCQAPPIGLSRSRRHTMSDNEGGQGNWVAPFAWGFVTGVLVCVGVGGTFFFTTTQRQRALEVEARAMADLAREEAERARAAAEAERRRTEQMLRAADEARRKVEEALKKAKDAK